MKKKIEVTIKDDKGNTTFYNQCVVDSKDSKRIQIPLGQILKQQKKGKVDPNKPVH